MTASLKSTLRAWTSTRFSRDWPASLAPNVSLTLRTLISTFEIRCGVLLDCRGHQRDRILGAAPLREGVATHPHSLTISPSFVRNDVRGFLPGRGVKSWPSLGN